MNGDPFAVAAFEGVALRHHRARQRPHDFAFGKIVGETVEIEMRHRLQHGDVDAPALAALAALEKCREDCRCRILPGNGIRDRRPDDTGIGRRRQQPQITAGGLRHGVERGTVS